MTVGIDEIVERVILQAQRMLDDGAYDWPASRAALTRILADLEARSVGDPALERLRQFVALGDDAWKVRQGPGTLAWPASRSTRSMRMQTEKSFSGPPEEPFARPPEPAN